MISRRRWMALLPVLGAVLAAAGIRPPPVKETRLTVFAAASLSAAFTDIAAATRGRDASLTVTFNFAASSQLAAQLEQGARADVFASADQHWMDYAREHSLTAGEPGIFARNRLVVVIPKQNPGRIQRLQDLGKPGLKLVLAAAAVPAGRYSRQVLENLGRAPGFAPGYRDLVLQNLVSNEETVKAVLTKVQLGEADAGIVYTTDITGPAREAVTTLEIPPAQNAIASYPIVVLRRAQEPVAARRFVEFVQSAAGQDILTRHGFLAAAE